MSRTRQPNEVFRSVVVDVTVEMVALLTGFGRAMEGSADDAADEKGLATSTDDEIAGMAVRFTLEVLLTTRSPEVAIEMEDVSVAISDEGESGV